MLTAARPVAARFLLHPSSRLANTNTNLLIRSMGTIADGVEFDTIAREWRCKVSKQMDGLRNLNEANAKWNLSGCGFNARYVLEGAEGNRSPAHTPDR